MSRKRDRINRRKNERASYKQHAHVGPRTKRESARRERRRADATLRDELNAEGAR